MKKLEGKYNKNFNSFIGALEGAMEISESGQSTVDLMGGTGFAFRLNIHRRLLPPGLDFPWGDELGYGINRFGYACRSMRSIPTLPVYDVYKKQAHHLILKGLEEGKASIAWNIQGSYFGVIVGCDLEKEVYLVSGILDDHDGPKEMAFSDLGKGEKTALAVYQPTQKICDDQGEGSAKAVLAYAIEHAEGPAGMIRGYTIGLEAYSAWKDAVFQDDIDPFGAAFTAHSVAEARSFVPAYLEKIQQYFPEASLKEAVEHYREVAEKLKEMAQLFPFDWKGVTLPSTDNRAKATMLIDQAGAAEKKAIEIFKKVMA